jgi:hypothetical protein
LTLTVEDDTAGKVRLKLEGTAVLANKEDVSAADMGFDARLLGRLEYDRAKKTFDRFDVAVLGDHWGAGPDNSGGVRSGRQPLGIFMELAGDNMPADRVPPQGARSLDFYLGRGE